MILSEADWTITRRTLNIGLHCQSGQRKNICVGANTSHRTRDPRILELLYLSTVSAAASARFIKPRHHLHFLPLPLLHNLHCLTFPHPHPAVYIYILRKSIFAAMVRVVSGGGEYNPLRYQTFLSYQKGSAFKATELIINLLDRWEKTV
jgi:hypothetical protein